MPYKNFVVIFFLLFFVSGIAYASDWIYPSDSVVFTTNGSLSGTGQNEMLLGFTVTSTILSVQSGDSWWAIANRYGMSMYTLASLNGKSTNSVIYPGQAVS